jgi:hypothetical protein
MTEIRLVFSASSIAVIDSSATCAGIKSVAGWYCNVSGDAGLYVSDDIPCELYPDQSLISKQLSRLP